MSFDRDRYGLGDYQTALEIVGAIADEQEAAVLNATLDDSEITDNADREAMAQIRAWRRVKEILEGEIGSKQLEQREKSLDTENAEV